jgi:hypothetical protein
MWSALFLIQTELIISFYLSSTFRMKYYENEGPAYYFFITGEPKTFKSIDETKG